MFCSSFCTAKYYNLDLIDKSYNAVKFHEDVVYIKLYEDVDVFIFDYGSFVIWNSTDDNIALIKKLCSEIAEYPIKIDIRDECKFVYDNETDIDEESDLFYIDQQDILIKLSMSYAFSQSAKLEVFERSTSKTIQETSFLTQQVKSYGKITLSRKKLSRLMGDLFEERTSINLDCDLLDTPEFFWKRPKYEPYYIMATDFFDIRQRMDVLHRRLGVVHDLYNFLSLEINNAHSTFLEWIIIILISIEIVMELAKQLKSVVLG